MLDSFGCVYPLVDIEEFDWSIKTEKPWRNCGGLFRKGGRRPTFPHGDAVSSALPGLTSLFGMGRGAPRRHSRHLSLSDSWLFKVRKDPQATRIERGSRPPPLGDRTGARHPVASTGRASSRAISAARLNVSPRFHLRPIDVVVYHGPLRRPHLGESFALRCFQRLSQPDTATRRCGWRRNRCTVGPSDPVLSY